MVLDGTYWLNALIWAALVGNALESGIGLAFWGFVMPGLRQSSGDEAIRVMVHINTAFVRGAMLPLFLATLMVSLALVVLAMFGLAMPTFVICGALVYIFGMGGVTVAFNVPMNARLEQLVPGEPATRAYWDHYLRRWGFWNAVRTCGGIASTVLLVCALS